MWHYKALHAGSYYLVQEKADSPVVLLFVAMCTEKCVLVEYQDSPRFQSWFRKDDELFEVIEQLSEEHAQQFEELFDNINHGLDDLWSEDEDEDDDDDEGVWTQEDEVTLWDATEEDDEEEDPSRLN